MFSPTVLHPTPDPNFVRELRLIDRDLRVVWGMDRYFVETYAIERKISPERYYRLYRSILDGGQPRYIERPIYDDDQPTFNEWGEPAGSRIVGYQKYDLAPEYEWVMFVEEPDHTFRALDSRTILELKRVYAWERFHSITRTKFEQDRERAEKEASRKVRRGECVLEGVDEGYTESGWRKSVGFSGTSE